MTNMTENFRVQLHHPILVFIGCFALLLTGCFIGMHLHPSKTATVWIAVSGALLMVIHEVSYGFLWISLTAWWIGKHHYAGDAADDRNRFRW